MFLNSADILECFQSGFRSHHSTETALLKVMNDLLTAVDLGENAILILLDLTAPFDHDILLAHLENWVGIRDTALDWFHSYLKSRTFSVSIGQFSSSPASFNCRVPQGSILAPLLMLALGNIVQRFIICFYVYADDSQFKKA